MPQGYTVIRYMTWPCACDPVHDDLRLHMLQDFIHHRNADDTSNDSHDDMDAIHIPIVNMIEQYSLTRQVEWVRHRNNEKRNGLKLKR